jgi:hypothetical protein
MTDSLRELLDEKLDGIIQPIAMSYDKARRAVEDILALLAETPPALAKGEEEISGDIMDDEVEKEWLDRVTSPAPAASEEEWPDIPDNMIRDKSTPRTRGET